MMKKYFIFALLFVSSFSIAQKKEVNYDESKVPAYLLPTLLQCNNGEEITSMAQWEKQRKPELLELFASQYCLSFRGL